MFFKKVTKASSLAFLFLRFQRKCDLERRSVEAHLRSRDDAAAQAERARERAAAAEERAEAEEVGTRALLLAALS